MLLPDEIPETSSNVTFTLESSERLRLGVGDLEGWSIVEDGRAGGPYPVHTVTINDDNDAASGSSPPRTPGPVRPPVRETSPAPDPEDEFQRDAQATGQ